jgi:hypothetical protein
VTPSSELSRIFSGTIPSSACAGHMGPSYPADAFEDAVRQALGT